MEDKKITFPEACGIVYGKGLQNYHGREINEENFMSQSAFGSCMGRGRALAEEAQKRVDNFRALVIVTHRRKKHEKEDTEITRELAEEETILLAVMPEEDIVTAGTYTWWNN